MSAKAKERATEGGHSCPPNGGLENPPSVESLVETEIGPMPSIWEVTTLQQVAVSIDYGTSVKCEHEKAGVPVLRIPNVARGSIDLADLKYGQPKRSELEDLRLRDGDLLFVRTNGVLENAGRCALYRGELEGCYFASYLIRVRVDSSKVLPAFVNEYARTERGRSFLSGCAIRTADGKFNINSGTLKRVLLPLPPLPEQRNIAVVLSVIQRAMEQQERLLTLTAELKKALLHQLFTAGLRGEPQKQTDIGPVPESWKLGVIGEVAKIQSGGTPTRDVPENWHGGTIPWVKTGEIDYCTIQTTEERITPVGLANSAARLFPAGTLLMAMYGQGVTRGRVAMLGIEATTNQACASITPHDESKVSSRFLYYFLEYHYENLRKLGHGANQRNMNSALIRGFPVAYPSGSEQAEIVSALSTFDAKQQIHQRKHAALTALFRTLLHQLMTAQIRVHDLDLPGILGQAAPEMKSPEP